MIKTHKIKIYPNSHMREELEKIFDYRRYVWNLALATWNDMYDVSIILDDKRQRPNERKVRDELVRDKADWQYRFSARVMQETIRDLGRAWKNCFNSNMPKHSLPKYKSKKNFRKTFKTDRAQIVNGKLRLDKTRENREGWYDIRLSEQPRWKGDIRLASVSLDVDGYYVSLAIEVEKSSVQKSTDSITAVDANVGRFDYKNKTSYQTEYVFSNTLFKLYDRIRFYQRRLARKRKVNPDKFNSRKYRAMRAKLKRAYQDVERIQSDLLHKFTNKLVTYFDVIAIEDLDNEHMKMNKRVAKNLHRSMFGKFKNQMKYKSDWNGNHLVLVDRFYPSTQRCSHCEYIKTGDDRIGLDGNKKHGTKHYEYRCYNCGVFLDRDKNAIENLIQYAVKSVGSRAIDPIA